MFVLQITLVNGLVLARSAFHHSMNYESVMVFGKATAVLDDDKVWALKVISDQVLPERWEESREPNTKELKATTVLKLSLEHASAKVRTGPPADEKEDYDLPIWAGVVPVKRIYENAQADPGAKAAYQKPTSVLNITHS